MTRTLVVLVLAGCGRLGFDDFATGTLDAATSAPGDVGTLLPDGRLGICTTPEPATCDACTNDGNVCDYGASICTCVLTRWHCQAPNVPECPATEPALSTACGAFTAMCSYGNQHYTCAAGLWDRVTLNCGTQ